jgi:hypothetical protein
MRMTRILFARVTIAYAAAILVVSSVDLSYEWRAHRDISTSVTRGFGIGGGYVGIWNSHLSHMDSAPECTVRISASWE